MLQEGFDRNQTQLFALESLVGKQSTVRIIDALVDLLDINALGFKIKGKVKNGRPAFPASILLKLLYYGYWNRVRSSRRLAREAQTNIEAMWLCNGLQPGYKTIAEFRKQNVKALEKSFYQLNKFLKAQGLFNEEIVAVDGSKFRAQNSKKNNYNKKKVDQHLEYIARETKKYLDELDQIDQVEEATEIELEQSREVSDKLDQLKQRKDKYTELSTQVEAAREEGQTQISTSDKDARALPKKMNIIEVSYNVLTAVEADNKLITNYKVDNKLDTYALSGMAQDARKVMEKQEGEPLTVLADKGFDTGVELKKCSENDIITLVAPKNRASSLKNKAFNKNAFTYDEELDCYICPRQQHLKTNGTWYNKNNGKYRQSYRVQHYKLPFAVCNACPDKLECAGAKLKNRHGQVIERNEYEPYIEDNVERVKLNPELYRQRQSIVEHPYGTIKRAWGYDYTLLKGIEKVAGEFATIFTIYNLRRVMSILGIEELIKRLKAACLLTMEQVCLILSRYVHFLYKFEKWIKFIFQKIGWPLAYRWSLRRGDLLMR